MNIMSIDIIKAVENEYNVNVERVYAELSDIYELT